MAHQDPPGHLPRNHPRGEHKSGAVFQTNQIKFLDQFTNQSLIYTSFYFYFFKLTNKLILSWAKIFNLL